MYSHVAQRCVAQLHGITNLYVPLSRDLDMPTLWALCKLALLTWLSLGIKLYLFVPKRPAVIGLLRS